MESLVRVRRSATFVVLVVASLLCLGVFAGCGENGDDISQQNSGRLQVTPLTIAFSSVPIGQTETERMVITNTGEDKLRIFELNFKAQENSTIDALTLENKPSGTFDIAPDESRTLDVIYEPKEEGRPNAGVIEIFSSDSDYKEGEALEVEVTTLGNRPQIRVNPSTVRFPRLPPGERMSRAVSLRNIGDAPLTIYKEPSIAGASDFRVKNLDANFPLKLAPAGGEADVTSGIEFDIEYAPTSDGSDEGDLVIQSNEEPGSTKEDPSIRRVEVNANADSACILVDKTTHNMGAVPLGGSATEAIRLESCGDEALEISAIELLENTADDEFEVELGDRDGNDDGVLDDPIVLEERGDTFNFSVRYTPAQAGSDQITLEIANNDPVQPEANIDVLANGASGKCPETELRARVKDGASRWRTNLTTAPLEYIILDGSESEDEDGRIVEYNWRVIKKPDGSTVRLNPVDGDPNDEDQSQREFRLLTAGKYEIGLQVKDNDGFTSCEEAVVNVTAVPNEKVHVELTWTNPEDPNENDDDGSDVDVHMVKMGPGKWFDAPYDIYFQNPENNWNPESPSLDIDDTNGAGPENIQMDDPQQCQWYAVGVHYYDQTYGTAYATIRVYINTRLVYEQLNKPLQTGDQFWDVARIHWPTGQVYNVDTLAPASPVDEKPPVTEAMKSSGLCTAQDLYEVPSGN